MSNNHTRFLGVLGAAAAVGLIASGCATKGFVRQEIDAVAGRADRAQAAADEASSAARAARRAGEAEALRAMSAAELARELALGNVHREEVRSVTLHFPFDSSELDEESKRELDGVVEELRDHPSYMVIITGYTDATGDEEYNLRLAERRAAAANLYLAQQLGRDFVRLAHFGFGESDPVGENSTSEGRRLNRRADVAIVRLVPAAEAAGGAVSSS